MRSVHGAVCTFRRPLELTKTLDAIASQTRRPDTLLVVDNDADPEIAELVRRHPISRALPVAVLGAPNNPGPAGAFALAYQHLRVQAADDDIMVIFDDDDPPPDQSTMEALLDLTDEAFADPMVGGIGLRGGRLDRRTGVVARCPSDRTRRTEPADHLHGGWFPCYRFSALEAVGDFDPSFFWGFEELDLGRRLIDRGFTLHVASELYFSVAEPRPNRALGAALPDRSWRHFYRHRNLLRVLRRDRAWTALALTIVVRLLGKPLVNVTRCPRLALWHLRTNIEAIVGGLTATPDAKHPHHPPT